MPGLLRGDFGLYAVAEHKIYRVGGDDDRGIGVFARASYSPPDRNLINYFADTGIEFIGLAEGQPKDKFGVAAAYAHVSPRARALDLDFQRLSTPALPARSFEGLVNMRGGCATVGNTVHTLFCLSNGKARETANSRIE